MLLLLLLFCIHSTYLVRGVRRALGSVQVCGHVRVVHVLIWIPRHSRSRRIQRDSRLTKFPNSRRNTANHVDDAALCRPVLLLISGRGRAVILSVVVVSCKAALARVDGGSRQRTAVRMVGVGTVAHLVVV